MQQDTADSALDIWIIPPVRHPRGGYCNPPHSIYPYPDNDNPVVHNVRPTCGDGLFSRLVSPAVYPV